MPGSQQGAARVGAQEARGASSDAVPGRRTGQRCVAADLKLPSAGRREAGVWSGDLRRIRGDLKRHLLRWLDAASAFLGRRVVAPVVPVGAARQGAAGAATGSALRTGVRSRRTARLPQRVGATSITPCDWASRAGRNVDTAWRLWLQQFHDHRLGDCLLTIRAVELRQQVAEVVMDRALPDAKRRCDFA